MYIKRSASNKMQLVDCYIRLTEHFVKNVFLSKLVEQRSIS